MYHFEAVPQSHEPAEPDLTLGLSPWLGRHVDLSRLVSDAVARVAGAIGAARGTAFLREPGTGSVVSIAGHHPELPTIRLAAGEGIAGHVVATGEAVNLPSVADDPRFCGAVDAVSGFVTRSILCVPLRDRGGRILGALQLLNKRRPFTDADEAKLRGLAAQLAVVLEATSWLGRLDAPHASPVAGRFDGIVGESPSMRALYERVARAATVDAAVLITGETGSGKGLVARAIHDNSARALEPFVTVDCAALPPTLVVNELFGHERGAFTGAARRSVGKFESAGRGTVFIDEIGELPLPAQGVLLRVLAEHRFERIGGTRSIDADVRVIAATHRDLEAMVARGTFRQDLYYRLRVLPVDVPSLRARGPEDLDLLSHHLVWRPARRHRRPAPNLDPSARARLHAHTWPGNVRELAHCLESAVILAAGPDITASDLPLPARVEGGAASDADLGRLTWQQMEQRYIRAVLDEHDGNRSAAARAMGVARATLLRKLKSLDE